MSPIEGPREPELSTTEEKGVPEISTTNAPIRAPFSYVGGKNSVADIVWQSLGDCYNYIEPFCGSSAVLLNRPQPYHGTETINDINGYVSNFWRSVAKNPEAVAAHADWPVLENDLHARHLWLEARRDFLRDQLERDPEWYDPKIAGWWVWGASTFFTGAWCVGEPRRCKPLCTAGKFGQGVNHPSVDIRRTMEIISVRMRRVRVLCGDFRRVLTPTVVLPPKGVTGVFLDPPYTFKGTDSAVYGKDNEGNEQIFETAFRWAVDNASPKVRIVVAGYDSRTLPEGWTEIPRMGHGGHGRRGVSNENRERERLWLSPACLRQSPEKYFSDIFGF